jgi:hypothetical protein
MFLTVQPFSYTSTWFAGIYVRGSIPKSFLVRVIMKVVRNTVEGVKFTFPMMAYFVLVAAWHYECHQLVKEIRKGLGNCNSEQRNKIIKGMKK